MAMDFSSWEQMVSRAPGYPDDNERLLAMQTLKVCTTEGPFANDDIAKNGYVVFDYVMFCYFVFRASLCRTFPRDFVETYDVYIQHLMKLYFDDFFAIPQKKISELFNSRAGEYELLPRDEDMAYHAMETLTQYIEKDLDGTPDCAEYLITDIFDKFGLQTKLCEYTIVTLKALERQRELILMFEANKPARQPRQEPAQPKTDFAKPAVEQRETKSKSKKDLVKGIAIFAIIAIVSIVSICLAVSNIRTEEFNSELRNFATEPMKDEYTNVYADVVSMEPEYFVYEYKTSNGIKIGDEDLWGIVCSCETVEGETIWVVFDVIEYPGGSYTEENNNPQYYSYDNPLRIRGSVDRAGEVTDELADAIGNIFILDVNRRPEQQ